MSFIMYIQIFENQFYYFVTWKVFCQPAVMFLFSHSTKSPVF